MTAIPEVGGFPTLVDPHCGMAEVPVHQELLSRSRKACLVTAGFKCMLRLYLGRL